MRGAHFRRAMRQDRRATIGPLRSEGAPIKTADIETALVVDDHPLYRAALADLARILFGDAAVFEASSAEAGLQMGSTHTGLRLILLDFRLPGRSGAEAVQAFRRRFPDAAIVVVSGSEQRREGEAALRAGARAFLSKASSMDVITEAIRAVLAGKTLPLQWIPAHAQALFDPVMADLTSRQLEILSMLCQGHSNKEITLRLGIAVVTVKTHISAIFRALGVVNRTQAVLAAQRLGLVSAGSDTAAD